MLMIFKQLIKIWIKLVLYILEFFPQQIPPFTLGTMPRAFIEWLSSLFCEKFLEPKGLNYVLLSSLHEIYRNRDILVQKYRVNICCCPEAPGP